MARGSPMSKGRAARQAVRKRAVRQEAGAGQAARQAVPGAAGAGQVVRQAVPGAAGAGRPPLPPVSVRDAPRRRPPRRGAHPPGAQAPTRPCVPGRRSSAAQRRAGKRRPPEPRARRTRSAPEATAAGGSGPPRRARAAASSSRPPLRTWHDATRAGTRGVGFRALIPRARRPTCVLLTLNSAARRGGRSDWSRLNAAPNGRAYRPRVAPDGALRPRIP